MSCACCDEITHQMFEWRKEAQSLEKKLAAATRHSEDRLQWWREEIDAKVSALRSNVALRGALTKAKKRIAELKGGAA